MIITKTPLRMSFFGGGTDFPEFYCEHGGAVLSTTFDKFCYVHVRHLPRFFNYSSELIHSEIEQVSNLKDIRHPLIREAMKYLDMHEIRMSYEVDLPARSGLGTSSSFAVGLLNAFHSIKGQYISKEDLAKEAIHLERDLCGEVGGVQDQIAAAHGGLNKILLDADGFRVEPLVIYPIRKRKLNASLLLFFTGFSRYSFEIQVETRSNLRDRTAELLEMKELVNEAEKILTDKDRDLNEFGRLMDYNWQMKRSLNKDISTSFIDEIYERAKKAGALGGKVLGAGGGGFILFYVELDKQASVRRALQDLLYVPFQFETEGTSVIYYQPETYLPQGKRANLEDDVWFDDQQGYWMNREMKEKLAKKEKKERERNDCCNYGRREGNQDRLCQYRGSQTYDTALRKACSGMAAGMPEGTEYYGDPSCNGTSASGDFGLFRGRKPDGDADILSG